MTSTLRHILLTIITAFVVMLLSCHEEQQQAMPMQQTMDSLMMWYGKMQGDSMEVKSQQVAQFLRQHGDTIVNR